MSFWISLNSKQPMINTKFDNHVNNIENKESNWGERERERERERDEINLHLM